MREEDRQRLVEVFADHVDPAAGPQWARRVCDVAVTVLPSVDAAALSLRTRHRAEEMLGASDAWAAGLEEQQYILGEGPGVQAFASGRVVLVPDLGWEEDRWPGFADAAGSAGAVAEFAFPLQLGAIRLGTLDLYRRVAGALPPAELADAAVVADLIAVSLLQHTETAGAELERSVSSYQDVNVATGMLAAQLNISLDDAFARIRAHAFTQNRSVVEVAGDVLARRLRLDQFTD